MFNLNDLLTVDTCEKTTISIDDVMEIREQIIKPLKDFFSQFKADYDRGDVLLFNGSDVNFNNSPPEFLQRLINAERVIKNNLIIPKGQVLVLNGDYITQLKKEFTQK